MRQPFGSITRAAVAAGAAVLAACGPKAPAPPPTPTTTGPALILYYADANGVHRLDARTGADSLLFHVSPSGVTSALSPDHAKLALGLVGPGSARLVVVDVASGRVTDVHSAGGRYAYTMAWSPAGDRLAFGYASGRGSRARGDILVTTVGGQPQRVGCDASKLVLAWTSRDTIVVGDGRDLFPVDVHGCRGKGVIYGAGKRDITFSPDGKLLFYCGVTTVRSGGRSVPANELFIATSDGLNERRVVGSAYDPRHAQWSPDGSRLALDVQSPEDPSQRYIALYDVVQQHLRFFPSHTPQGVPRDTDPYWVPDGTAVVHERVLGRQHDLILRTLADDPTAVHVEPTVLMSGPSVGSVWGWVDATRMVVVSDQGTKVLTKDGAIVYSAPGDRNVLAVAPAR